MKVDTNIIESIDVSPYTAKQKKETTSRRGKDLKPRHRRSYKQLQEETREYHFCPCAGCERKYVGTYGSFNLFVHVKNKHFNGSLDARSLRKRRIDVVPMPGENGGPPTKTRHITYVLLSTEEIEAAGNAEPSTPEASPEKQAPLTPTPQVYQKSSSLKKPISPTKRRNNSESYRPVMSSSEIEAKKAMEKLKMQVFFTDPVKDVPVVPLTQLYDERGIDDSFEDLEDNNAFVELEPINVEPVVERDFGDYYYGIGSSSPSSFEFDDFEVFA